MFPSTLNCGVLAFVLPTAKEGNVFKNVFCQSFCSHGEGASVYLWEDDLRTGPLPMRCLHLGVCLPGGCSAFTGGSAYEGVCLQEVCIQGSSALQGVCIQGGCLWGSVSKGSAYKWGSESLGE